MGVTLGRRSPGGPFTLVSVDGRTVTDRTLNGVLIYFGYTSCPDACPTALNKMGVAFASDRMRTGLMGDRFDLESKRILVLAPTGRDSVAA